MPSAKKKAGSPKFQRLSREQEDRTDVVGKVVVTLALREGSGYVKGNMTKTITIPEARVSDVYEAIELALFG